jgi:hypothetical protein
MGVGEFYFILIVLLGDYIQYKPGVVGGRRHRVGVICEKKEAALAGQLPVLNNTRHSQLLAK